MSGLVTFGSVAPVLEANGFQPIPITLPSLHDPHAGKRPAVDDWRRPRRTAYYLPRYARFGVGLLTATTPAADIDVRHPDVAAAIDREVADRLGDAPTRIGAAPKCLRLFRASKPFPKISTAEYALPGDQPGDKGHKVEVLGDGQQFVAFGIHPSIRRPYHWPDFSPLDLEWQDLPELTAETAAAIIAKAEELLQRAGGRIRARRAMASKAAADRRPGPPPRMVRGLDEACQVLTALRRIDPNQLGYDDWVLIAYGLKAAFGERGRDMWMRWSRRSKKDHADTTAKTWGWVRPERAGWRYVIKIAEASHGR